MARGIACALLLVAGVFSHITSAKRGYILTAPSRFIPGRAEKVCIDLIDVTTSVSVELGMYKSAHAGSVSPVETSEQNLVGRQTFTIPPTVTTKCVSMTLPEGVTTKYLVLAVRGDELPLQPLGWSFYGENVVRVLDRHTPTEVCLVQTDKPDYKPSQTVQIRVLRLDTRLRPVNQAIESVSIRTPSGVTVEQWLNVPVRSGLAALKFQLAEEPSLGSWSVVVSGNGMEEIKTFNVKSYELASFDVDITPPPSVMLRDEAVSAVICATYTYGRPVTGTLSGSICLVQSQMRLNISEGAFCHNITEQTINGCANISADRASTGWDYRYSDWANSELLFQISVKDTSTSETVAVPETRVHFTNSPFKLYLQGSDAFKPGLPYYAKVMVTTADGEPASAQLVSLVVDNKSTGQPAPYTKVYTTDTRGTAYVTIPPFMGHHIDIEATLSGSLGHPSLTTRLSPKAWYSPSGSYLQIVPLKDSNSLACGSRAQYTVQYTTGATSNVTLFYKVVGVGDITAAFHQSVTLATTALVSAKDPSVSWDLTSSWQTTVIRPNADVAAKPVNVNSPEFNPAMTIKTATHKGSLLISFPVTSDLSPSGHLVVYYVRASGEVVSDSIILSVPECTANEVSLSLSRQVVSPKQTVQLTLTARPSAVCGYSVVERNSFVHSSSSYPTLSSIIRRLEDYLLPTSSMPSFQSVNYYCSSLHGVPTEYPGFASYWQRPSLYRHRDSHQGFVEGGLTVSSTLHIRTAPCRRVYYRTGAAVAPAAQSGALPGGLSAATTGGAVLGQLSTSAASPAVSAVDVVSVTPQVSVIGVPPSVPDRNSPREEVTTDALTAGPRPQMLQFVEDVNSYFPETMLFDLVDLNTAGMATVQVAVPDTITQWIASAICVDDQDGLGVSTPVTLTAFHPYAVTVKLPSNTAIRGEIIPVQVTVTNYLTACLTVNLAIQPSPNYMIIGQLMLASEPSLCICGGGTATKTYNIFLQEIGEDVPITITANTVNNHLSCPVGSIMSNRIGLTETVVKRLDVESEGIPRQYTYGDFICLDSTAPATSTFTKDYRLPRPSSRSRVSQSTQGSISVVGDVLGPVIAQPDHLISPAVGGEANVVRFAPSAFILKYLDATRQHISTAAREDALQNLKSGYQHQLTYVHPDGSYSLFGPNQGYEKVGEGPSLWLTAYILKSFGHAKSLIHIDGSEMEKSLQYIVSKQDSWGCFPKVGMLHNKAMRTAVDRTLGDNYALTAYIVVAMLEAGYGDAAMQPVNGTAGVIDKALDCIFIRSRRFRVIRDGYTLALVSYAFALHDPTDARSVRAFGMLMRQQSTGRDGHNNWRAMRTSSRVRTGSHWFNRPLEVDVEATSYGLLSTMIMANRSAVLTNGYATVQWLSEERNNHGGFGTSQDTVIALQALSEYTTKFAPRTADVRVTAHFTSTVNNTRTLDQQVAAIDLTTATRLTETNQDLPRVRTLAVAANGTGCFRFQVHVKYNVIQPDSVGQPYATTVAVRNNTRMSQLCQRKPLLVCTSYTLGGVSKLTVMEVKMQTGWQVEDSLVKQLLNFPSLGVKRYDVSPNNGALTLYFSSLGSKRICFFVYTKKIAAVRNGQPAVVTTYNYYRRDARQETTYHITC